MTRIASRKYLNGSRGQPCTLRIAGVCTGGGEDTVFAHIRDRHTGRSIKASDISGADCCWACHEVFDRRARLPADDLGHRIYLPDDLWMFYALRGIQETMERRIAQGILVLPLDVEKPMSEKPTPPRKPKAERQAMQSRGFQQGPAQKIASRPFPVKQRTK